MKSRQVKAKDKFSSGFNCAQSVLLAFAEDLDLEEEVALKISSGFGAGMGRMQNTCGAVTGAFMVIGALNGQYKAEDKRAKEETHSLVRKFSEEFKGLNNTINCQELIGVNINTKAGMEEAKSKNLFSNKCGKYIEDAVKLLEDKYL
ncbi:C-GCAxxG-C-C family protein [Orenia marismortui]|uniref:C-GCAxxG-C-C family protein n=1 Tax=Orenia marismortui TaxID=46469 RepID=UPI00035F17B7|nr:C-GCAxxG-C-C family protein [Orenia marismortui]